MSSFDGRKKTAVALKYDEENNPAPVIVASGLGHMAEKMVEIATVNNIPVFEDSSLSTVLSQLELGAEIPDELYQVIVDIYVYFLHYLPKGQADPGRPREAVKPRVEAAAKLHEAVKSREAAATPPREEAAARPPEDGIFRPR